MQLDKNMIDKFTRSAVGQLNIGNLTAEESKMIIDFRTRLVDSLVTQAMSLRKVEDYMYERMDEFITSQIVHTSLQYHQKGDIKNEPIVNFNEIKNEVNQSLNNLYANYEGNVQLTMLDDMYRQMKDLANPIHPRFSPIKTVESAYKANRSDLKLRHLGGMSLLDPKYEEQFKQLPKEEQVFVLYNLGKNERHEMRKNVQAVVKNTQFLDEIRKQYDLPKIKSKSLDVPDTMKVFDIYGYHNVNQTKGRFGVKESRGKELANQFLLYRDKTEVNHPLPASVSPIDKLEDKSDTVLGKAHDVGVVFTPEFGPINKASKKADKKAEMVVEQSEVLQNDLEKEPTAQRVDRKAEKTDATKPFIKNPEVRAFLKRHKVAVGVAATSGIVGLHMATGGLSSVALGFYAGGMVNKYNVVDQVKEAMVRKMQDAKVGVKQEFHKMKEDVKYLASPVKNVVKAGYGRLSNFARQFKEAFSYDDGEKLKEYNNDIVVTEAAHDAEQEGIKPEPKKNMFARKFIDVPELMQDQLYDEAKENEKRLVYELNNQNSLLKEQNAYLKNLVSEFVANNDVDVEGIQKSLEKQEIVLPKKETVEKVVEKKEKEVVQEKPKDDVKVDYVSYEEFSKPMWDTTKTQAEVTSEVKENDASLDASLEEDTTIELKDLLASDYESQMSDDEFKEKLAMTVDKEHREAFRETIDNQEDLRAFAAKRYMDIQNQLGNVVYEYDEVEPEHEHSPKPSVKQKEYDDGLSY